METSPVNRQQPAGAPRAHTMRLQGLANRVVLVLLRTPLICRVVGRKLVTVYVIGRKSGTRYAVPVAYLEQDGTLLVGTPFAWAKNLRTGTPVDIRLRGRLQKADVQVIADRSGVIKAYGEMARTNAAFASFNRVGRDQQGNPDPHDLELAWEGGARAIKLSPRGPAPAP